MKKTSIVVVLIFSFISVTIVSSDPLSGEWWATPTNGAVNYSEGEIDMFNLVNSPNPGDVSFGKTNIFLQANRNYKFFFRAMPTNFKMGIYLFQGSEMLFTGPMEITANSNSFVINSQGKSGEFVLVAALGYKENVGKHLLFDNLGFIQTEENPPPTTISNDWYVNPGVIDFYHGIVSVGPVVNYAEPYDSSLTNQKINLIEGGSYKFSFNASQPIVGRMRLIKEVNGVWSVYSSTGKIDIAAGLNSFILESDGTAENASLILDLGYSENSGKSFMITGLQWSQTSEKSLSIWNKGWGINRGELVYYYARAEMEKILNPLHPYENAVYKDLSVVSGKSYALRFTLENVSSLWIQIRLFKNSSPWTEHCIIPVKSYSSGTYEALLTAKETELDARLYVEIGYSANNNKSPIFSQLSCVPFSKPSPKKGVPTAALMLLLRD